ncbi:MAG: LLM class flavin-dependent oxidoreductase [Actinomycetota bacterium]|nr:LLM class flavin-dependent oxidoreductase [Actinomycetota bacterium]
MPEGTTAAEALAETIRLAQHAEQLGYHRYWVAEHHNTRSLAGTAPEVMVAAVAAATSQIRVGSGGVLLPYRSPLMVAEQFRVLHSLFPGRIDLGVGRAAGTDPATEELLRRGSIADGEELFPQRVADVVEFLDGAPDVWVLGSSSQSSGCAAYLGLSFSFAHFISPTYGPQIVTAYRRGFVPSGGLGEPRVNVAVSAVCADTDDEARRVASTADLWRLGPEGTARRPILPAEDVAGALTTLTPLERERLAQVRAKVIVGAPEQVRSKLTALAHEFDVDELIVLTVCHDPAARRRSYELLAEAFDLAPRPLPSPP